MSKRLETRSALVIIEGEHCCETEGLVWTISLCYFGHAAVIFFA